MQLLTYFERGALLALIFVPLVSSCKARQGDDGMSTIQEANAFDSAQGFDATYFEAHGKKGFSCDGVAAFPEGFNLIAVTENSPLLPPENRFTCIDNFIVGKPWEGAHWFNTIDPSKVTEVMTEFSNLKYPNDPSKWAFKFENNQWSVNQPDCHTPMKAKNICGLSVKVGTSQGAKDAVVFDACPQNHWNNAIKDHPNHPDNLGGKGNPCRRGNPHIDLHGQLWNDLMLPKVNGVRVHATMNPVR